MAMDAPGRIRQSPPGLLQRLWGQRWLIIQWSRRDYRVRFRQTGLGFLWALVQPALLLCFYGVLFVGIFGIESDRGPYVLFAWCGLAPWTFVASAVGTGVPSLINAQAVLSKVYFPREVVPISAVAVMTIDLGVSTFILLWLVVITGAGLHLSLVAIVPVYLSLALIVAGAVVLASMVTVFLRDLHNATPLLLQVLFVASPVMYPATLVPERWRDLYQLNPIAHTIEQVRTVAIDGRWPTPVAILVPTAVGLILVLAAILYTRSVEDRIPDIV